MHDSEFRLALQRYSQVREAAYRAAEDEALRNRGLRHPFRFAPIDAAALDTWRAIWVRSHPFGYGGWDWEGLARPIWRRPAGFHLAVWSQDDLCGLAVGRASRRRPCGLRHTLSLHFLEANPDPNHPLKGHIAELVIACAESYGAALGAKTLRLVNPLPGLLRLYLGPGFSVAHNVSAPLYLERSIKASWRDLC